MVTKSQIVPQNLITYAKGNNSVIDDLRFLSKRASRLDPQNQIKSITIDIKGEKIRIFEDDLKYWTRTAFALAIENNKVNSPLNKALIEWADGIKNNKTTTTIIVGDSKGVAKKNNNDIFVLSEGVDISKDIQPVKSPFQPFVSILALRIGEEGPEVEKLQKLLKEKVDPEIDVDGIFGTETKAAIESFQRSKSLTETGFIDFATKQALENAPSIQASKPVSPSNGPNFLKLGSKGEDVRTLQNLLNSKTNAGLVVDGDFGESTQAALKDFQESTRELEATGIYDLSTQQQLEKAETMPAVQAPIPTPKVQPKTEAIIELTQPKKYKVISSNGINVRSTPEEGNNRIDGLAKDAEVTVYANKGDWARITPSNETKEQWVKLKFLEEINVNQSVTPSTPAPPKPTQITQLNANPANFNSLKSEMDKLKVEQNTVFGDGNILKLDNEMAITASHVLVEEKDDGRDSNIYSTYTIDKDIKAKVSYRPAGSLNKAVSEITIPAGTDKNQLQKIADDLLMQQGVKQKFINPKMDKEENFVDSQGKIKIPYKDDDKTRTLFRSYAHPNNKTNEIYRLDIEVNPLDLKLIKQETVLDLPPSSLGNLGDIGKTGSTVVTLGQDFALIGKPGTDPKKLNQKAQELRSKYTDFANLASQDPYKPLPTLIYTKGDGKDFKKDPKGKPRYIAGYVFPKPLDGGRRLFVPIPEGASIKGLNFSFADNLDDYQGQRGNSGSFTTTMLPNGKLIHGGLSGSFRGLSGLETTRGLNDQDLAAIKASLTNLGYPKDFVDKFNLADSGPSAIAYPGTDAELKQK